jgi:tRNA-modifying protein YgfZ
VFAADEYDAVTRGTGFRRRDELGRLRVGGADRRSYLHGILTNDIDGLSAGTSRYAALLTPQGRMITDMQVYDLGETLLLTLPRPLAAAIRDRLDQYVFTEDVQADDVTERTVQFGLYGPQAQSVVASLAFPQAPIVVASRDFGIDGFEVIAAAEQSDEVEAALLARGAVEISDETADALRLEAGIPRFLVDMTTDTIPLEAGIEDRAISMSKGCYPGQEVIVRVLHRGGGRVAKKLVGVLLTEGAAVPAIGARIQSAEREIGAVTSAAHSPRRGRAIALGYVHRDFAAPGTVLSVAGAPAEVVTLPF